MKSMLFFIKARLAAKAAVKPNRPNEKKRKKWSNSELHKLIEEARTCL